MVNPTTSRGWCGSLLAPFVWMMIDEASLEFPPVAWQYPGQIGSAEGTGALSHTAILPTQAQVNLFYGNGMAQSRESCAAALVPQSSKISLLIVPTATETLTSSTRRNTSCPVTASPPRPRLTSHFSVLLRFPLHFTSLRYIAIPLQIINRARLIHSLARFFVSQPTQSQGRL